MRKRYGPTPEIVGDASWREIRIVVAWCIGIAFLTNLLLVLAPTTNVGYLALKGKWDILLNLEEPVDLLVLGDSSCRQGFLPNLAAERLGLGAGLNLCTTGDALVVNDAWMLDVYLRRFAPPQAVIVVHTFDAWPREPSPPTIAQIPLEWGFWRRLEPEFRFGTEASLLTFASRYLPLYANDQTLGEFVQRPMRSIQRYREFRERMGPDGFVEELEAFPRGVRSSAERTIRLLEETTFRVSEANSEAMERLKELAERHEIPLYLLHAPVYRGLAAAEPFRAYMGELRAYLRDYADGNRVVRYLPELVTFEADVMQNMDHVTLPAAERYTLSVVSTLAAGSDRAPRRTALGAAEPEPASP